MSVDRFGLKSRLKRMAPPVAAAVLAFGLLTAAAGQAGAFLIDNGTSVDDMFTVSFRLEPGEADNAGNILPGTEPLTAQIKYTVVFIDLDSTGEVALTVDITNTTTPDPAFAKPDHILGFGFFTNPEITVGSFTPGTVFDNYAEDTNFPSVHKIDVCIFAQNCSGGNINGGLAPGASDQVMIALLGDFSGGSLELAPHAIKFQGDRGSFQIVVPEPSSLAIFGIGLLGLGLFVRRRGVLAV